MKRIYTKPEILFENFSSSASVASGCGTLATYQSGVCPYETLYAGVQLFIFTGEVSACTTKEQDGDYNGICYHVPSETYTLFTS